MRFNKVLFKFRNINKISYKEESRNNLLYVVFYACLGLFFAFSIESFLRRGLSVETLVFIFGLIFTFVSFYLSRIKSVFYGVAVLFFAFLLVFFFPFLWRESGGLFGFLPFFFIFYVVSIIFIFQGRERIIFLFLAFAMIAVLVGMDFIYPTYERWSMKALRVFRGLSFVLVSAVMVVVNLIAVRKYTLEKQRVERLSKVDYLTGLLNRREGMERFDYIVDYLSRSGNKKLCLIMMDIDDFKSVNDTYGHICGDAVLKKIGEIINKSVRKTDIAIRWGGEEFLLILPEVEVEKAFLISERIREAFKKERFNCKSNYFNVTITSGVSDFDFNKSKEENIYCADSALYKGKREGKDRSVIIYSASPDCRDRKRAVSL